VVAIVHRGRLTDMRQLRSLALAAVAGCFALAALTVARATVPAPTRPVALVDAWASTSPIAGFRCSGVRLDRIHVATARHCVLGHDLAIVDGGSLCHPIPDPVMTESGSRSTDRLLARVDLAILTVELPTEWPELRIERATAGQALVWAYGVGPGSGRPSCSPSLYRGELGRCEATAARGGWCLTAPPDRQLCGGSSGAPVFLQTDAGWSLVGVVSRGPRCGERGPVVVATLPDPW
jgi:hypothetical protein